MRLRIVGGELGGRRFPAPSGARTRPTRESVREAWFSALGARIRGARVLDLFAGSGALGLEALSRGAASVVFVESDRRAVALLTRTLAELGVRERARVVRRDAFAFLGPAEPGDPLPATGRHEPGGAGGDRGEPGEAGGAPPAVDVALADPPYEGRYAERLVERFRRRPFAAMLCVEHAAGDLTDAGAVWRRRYGDTALSFFLAGAAPGPDTPDTGGPCGEE